MNSASETQQISLRNINRIKIAGVVVTLVGVALFGYFVYRVGLDEIRDGVVKFGFAGFAVILFLYFLRILSRAWAWKLSVYEDNGLRIIDAVPAVLIGEALSSMIPLGILISGTAKAVAVRKRLPLVVAFSSVATENLFFCYIVGIFLVLGAAIFLNGFDLPQYWIIAIDLFTAVICALMVVGFIMILRQWHFASEFLEWLYNKGVARRHLEHLRLSVRLFENLIYGFYRQHPKRFIPICLLEVAFYLLGAVEIWYILSRITAGSPGLLNPLLLETVNRVILMLFKLVPFVVGVDEAGSQLVTNTLGFAAGVGVTIALIRKGRVIFWTAIGLILIVKRGLSIREIREAQHQ